MNNTPHSALSVTQEAARELMQAGAVAVMLTGSRATGNATAESDIDLYAIGNGPEYLLERRGDFLVSVSWRREDEIERSYSSPADIGVLVPGWRQAIILTDPDGVAARLAERATAWTWDVIGDDPLNEWVAEQLTGYAEEVHKLVAHIARETLQYAAAQRSILALRIPIIMAVHKRILYGSENRLWDLVADRMGSEWAKKQSAALGLTGQPFHDSCTGALELYVMACACASDLFDNRQQVVIEHACKLALFKGPSININSVIVILIERNGRFLMIEEDRGPVGKNWYFPSGAVEAGESLVDAAIREAFEETGYSVKPTHLLRIDHGYFARSREIPWWRHIIVAHPTADVAKAGPEEGITAVEWLSPDDLDGLDLRSPDAHEIIATYLQTGPGLPLPGYFFSESGELRGFYS